jgi:hypothetical protein
VKPTRPRCARAMHKLFSRKFTKSRARPPRRRDSLVSLDAPVCSTIRIKINDPDIGYFAILQQMSGFADRMFEYFAILQQMGGFADRIFGYFEILVHVQVSGIWYWYSICAPDPYIRILVDTEFITGYLLDIWRKNI